MTAIVLQFPRPTRPKPNRAARSQPCEVISLDAWRRKVKPQDDLDNVVLVQFHNEPHLAKGSVV